MIHRAAGLLLVVVPLTFAACFTLLQQLFEYPDILRQPTPDILAKFQAGGAPLIAVWYVLTLTALGPAFRVDESTSGSLLSAQVAMNPNSEFVITWHRSLGYGASDIGALRGAGVV